MPTESTDRKSKAMFTCHVIHSLSPHSFWKLQRNSRASFTPGRMVSEARSHSRLLLTSWNPPRTLDAASSMKNVELWMCAVVPRGERRADVQGPDPGGTCEAGEAKTCHNPVGQGPDHFQRPREEDHRARGCWLSLPFLFHSVCLSISFQTLASLVLLCTLPFTIIRWKGLPILFEITSSFMGLNLPNISNESFSISLSTTGKLRTHFQYSSSLL